MSRRALTLTLTVLLAVLGGLALWMWWALDRLEGSRTSHPPPPAAGAPAR